MADEFTYTDRDAYGSYEDYGNEGVTFKALDAIISNLRVGAAQIEAASITEAHIKSLKGIDIEAVNFKGATFTMGGSFGELLFYDQDGNAQGSMFPGKFSWGGIIALQGLYGLDLDSSHMDGNPYYFKGKVTQYGGEMIYNIMEDDPYDVWLGTLQHTFKQQVSVEGKVFATEYVVASDRNIKKAIEAYTDSALAQIVSTPIFKYHYLNDVEEVDLKYVGMILDQSPVEIADITGKGVNVYPMAAMAWRAIQELDARLSTLENPVSV